MEDGVPLHLGWVGLSEADRAEERFFCFKRGIHALCYAIPCCVVS